MIIIRNEFINVEFYSSLVIMIWIEFEQTVFWAFLFVCNLFFFCIGHQLIDIYLRNIEIYSALISIKWYFNLCYKCNRIYDIFFYWLIHISSHISVCKNTSNISQIRSSMSLLTCPNFDKWWEDFIYLAADRNWPFFTYWRVSCWKRYGTHLGCRPL